LPIDKPRRASGSEKRQRTATKLIRFTPAELAQIEEAASRAGLTFASFGRAQMLSALPPRSVRRPPVEKELLAKILGQLGKAGSNLNQVARAANIGRDQLEETRTAIAEVRLAVQAVMRMLGRQA
jgi:hypothetical protein